MNLLIDASLSGNTKQVYTQALSAFTSFLREYNIQACWPPTLQQLVQFVAHLSKFKNFSFSTINAYLSGISFYLKINNLQDFTRAFVIQKMLCGLRRIHPVKDTRMPITLDMLKQLTSALPFVCTSIYEANLFKAAFVVAFFGFLRVSEIAVDGVQAKNTIPVQASDICMSDHSCTLRIPASKTDQYGNSASLIFSQSSDPAICPVRRMTIFLQARPRFNGPLFCHFSGAPLTKYQFRAVLFKCLKFCNIKAKITSHSFRIGSATLASSLSIPEEDIKRMGRWSNRGSTHKRYIRLQQIIP